MFVEFGIGVGVPIEHVEQVVEIVMVFGRDVFDQQVPRHGAAFDQRLIHREDVGVDLRFVGDQRTGRVQNAGVDLPAGAGLQAVGLGEVQNAVVAFVPALQAAAHIVARGAGFQAHERVGKIVVGEIVLRREVVGLGLALLSDAGGEFVGLVQMVRESDRGCRRICRAGSSRRAGA